MWLASRQPSEEAALKILTSVASGAERYNRFVQEVRVLRRVGNLPGILPLLDASLPESPTRNNPAWLAMPVAVPIRAALESPAGPREVVEAVASIANTLASLVEEHSLFHRDVKPENLYSWQDGWCVGDFGLVDDPLGEAYTEPGRLLGPRHYLAPEVFGTSPFDSGPTDVYALAKTLWVLITRQSYPLPGQLTVREQVFRLSEYVSDGGLGAIELLIERSTHPVPARRPSMSEFHAELRAWLSPTQSDDGTAVPLDSIRERVRHTVGLQLSAHESKRARENHVHSQVTKLREHLVRIGEDIREVTTLTSNFGAVSYLGDSPAFSEVLRAANASFSSFDALHVITPKSRGAAHTDVYLMCGLAVAAMADDSVRMCAAYVIYDQRLHTVAWQAKRTAHRGSAVESELFLELIAELRGALPGALSAYADALGTPE